MKRFYKDIERCPYVPSEPKYDEWNKKDQERLAQIDRNRTFLLEVAKSPNYKDHYDYNVREMAQFVIEFLDGE